MARLLPRAWLNRRSQWFTLFNHERSYHFDRAGACIFSPMNRSGGNEKDLARFHIRSWPAFNAQGETALLHISENVTWMGMFGFARAGRKFHQRQDAFMAGKISQVLLHQNVALGATLLSKRQGQKCGDHNRHYNRN